MLQNCILAKWSIINDLYLFIIVIVENIRIIVILFALYIYTYEVCKKR